ncbi:MAG: replication initiator protein [Microvirus sp.]|nr:MAG: replication initiator protein [Microvirus sp.]
MTYNDENLPISKKGIPTLDKSRLKSFLFDLRRKNERVISKYWKDNNKGLEQPKMKQFKYFSIGEYGDKKQRPHYHLLVFNLFSETLKYLSELWSEGNIVVDICKPGAIHYVSGYMLKNQAEYQKFRERMFLLASNHLGEEYLKNTHYHVSNMNLRVKVNGFPMTLPRHYKNKMFTKEQSKIIRDENIKRSIEEDEDWIKKKEEQNIDWELYRLEQIDQLYKNKERTKSKKRKL